jgi:hypothetical protein
MSNCLPRDIVWEIVLHLTLDDFLEFKLLSRATNAILSDQEVWFRRWCQLNSQSHQVKINSEIRYDVVVAHGHWRNSAHTLGDIVKIADRREKQMQSATAAFARNTAPCSMRQRFGVYGPQTNSAVSVFKKRPTQTITFDNIKLTSRPLHASYSDPTAVGGNVAPHSLDNVSNYDGVRGVHRSMCRYTWADK